MAQVVRGQMNKQIAASLGLSEIMIKVYRGQMMRKMQATSLTELLQIAGQLRQVADQDPTILMTLDQGVHS